MNVIQLGLRHLRRHGANARDKREYTKAEVADLVASVREHGLLQPLVVTPDRDSYRILAGHRRHAALKVLGMTEAPCVVVDADEAKALAILVSDNGQHRAVDPLREAEAVAKLVEGLAGQDHPHDRAAAVLGKSASWVRARLRLCTLSEAWRASFADPGSPVHEFPVGHIEVVAALPQTVQDEVLADCEGRFREGVPLAAELRRIAADYTRELDGVPWDLAAENLVEGVSACSTCPKRDGAQDSLFAAVSDTKGDRCLDAPCYEAKKRAAVHAAIAKAREKHGDQLAVEVSWGFPADTVPEGTPTYREFELSPLAKSKGGVPVLRLKDMKIVFMGKASRHVEPGIPTGQSPEQPAGPKPLEERRRDLDKRRLVRALSLVRGSLLGQPVEVGTERHPEQATPPALGTPALPDLIALALAFGTGRAVGDDGPPPWDQTDSERLSHAVNVVRGGADSGRARDHLWAVLRDPIAKLVNPIGGLSREGVEERVNLATDVCGFCGVSWDMAYVTPSVEAIPEPRSWAALKAS